MEVTTYSHARNHLKSIMDRVCDNYEEVVVTRKDDKNVVILSLEEYNAIRETLYLASTPANRDRLRASIAQLEAGEAEEKILLDQ